MNEVEGEVVHEIEPKVENEMNVDDVCEIYDE